MKRLFLIFILSFCSADILHVNSQAYNTIQSAIDDAISGDTVLVYQGVYYENLDIDKTITLTSFAIFDDLNEWYNYNPITDENEIINENILNTIIDGSNSSNNDFKSCLVLRSTSEECINPVVMGLTFRGGKGTKVTELIETDINDEGYVEVEQMIGGAIFSYMTNSLIHHNQFSNNGDTNVEYGGAAYSQTSAEDWGFDNRSSYTPRCEINEINFHDNFFRENEALHGNTFSDRTFNNNLNLSNSVFDVYNCADENITETWLNIKQDADVEYESSIGDLCSIDINVWVSMSGSDEFGDGGILNPFKTLKHAIEILAPTEENQLTIFLEEGIYSSTNTSETFPIILPSNINIIGQGKDVTIIDAELNEGAIRLQNSNNNLISDLTIMNGNVQNSANVDDYGNYNGGGIYLWNSNPNISNVNIKRNTGAVYGGGMYLWSSSPVIENVIISGNLSDNGAGISIHSDSNPILRNTVITRNYTINRGGGIFIAPSSNATLNRVEISENLAYWEGGAGIYMRQDSEVTLVNVTISRNMLGVGWGSGIHAENGLPWWSSTDPPHIIMKNSINKLNDYQEDFYFNDWMNGGELATIDIDYSNIMDQNNSDDLNGVGNACTGCDAPFGGCVQDCDLACVPQMYVNSWTGDGDCDEAIPNLNCNYFDFDVGDCEQGFGGTGNINVPPNFQGLSDQGCENTNYSATDGDGNDCSFYDNYPIFCGGLVNINYNDDDFSSNDMCCACGGGTTSTGELTDYSLLSISECIDAGDSYAVFPPIIDYYGDAPDMGAYEFFDGMVGDLNQDNQINVLDIIIMVDYIIGDYSFSGFEFYQIDCNADELVDVIDILLLVQLVLDDNINIYSMESVQINKKSIDLDLITKNQSKKNFKTINSKLLLNSFLQ